MPNTLKVYSTPKAAEEGDSGCSLKPRLPRMLKICSFLLRIAALRPTSPWYICTLPQSGGCCSAFLVFMASLILDHAAFNSLSGRASMSYQATSSSDVMASWTLAGWPQPALILAPYSPLLVRRIQGFLIPRACSPSSSSSSVNRSYGAMFWRVVSSTLRKAPPLLRAVSRRVTMEAMKPSSSRYKGRVLSMSSLTNWPALRVMGVVFFTHVADRLSASPCRPPASAWADSSSEPLSAAAPSFSDADAIASRALESFWSLS
mmetsp:Transcript_2631/g.6248  ORF Transcript_2631/g.6248 Transcript_2631/m.6248 type:complete len:261 (+) Transcript_2631:3637-4419(+)